MKLYGYNVYGSHFPNQDEGPSAPLEPLAPYIRTQPQVNAFSIEVGEPVNGSEGFWGGRPRPVLSVMWQTAASPDGPWTDTDVTTSNINLTQDYVDLYLSLLVTAENSQGASTARSNIIGPIIAEEVEPEEPAGPNGPVMPEFLGDEALGFAGHSSVGEIFDGGGFDANWNGQIFTNIIGGDTNVKMLWDADGPERNNPVEAIIFSDMDVSPVGRYPAPDTAQGIENLQYAYWYGLTAAEDNGELILVWHTTPRHSYDGSYEFNRASRNYTRNWLSEKLNRNVYIMPIDLYVKTMIDAGIPRTQIWRDDYHLADNVNGVGPKVGLGVMLHYMLTGDMIPVSEGNELYQAFAIAAVDNHRWAGAGGTGNDQILTVADPLPNPSPLPYEGSSILREASTATDLKVHSGHSLVDTYINEGEAWPGFLPSLFEEQFGPVWVFEGTDYKDTVPGSPMRFRWQEASDPRGAVLGIARYQSLVVTEGGPPFRLNAQNTSEYITDTLEYAMNFAENAYRNGNNGNGAESILWSIWPNITGWLTDNPETETQGANWRDLGGFRPVTVEYGRTFRYIADYVSWKMNQIHPELGGNYRMWLFPGHAWFVRLYDDIQAGLVPGMTSHVDLFRDDIHPNPTGSYALSVFMHTMLYQVDARPLTYRPTFVSAELDAYFKAVAWDIATSYAGVGMGGTIEAEPVFIGGTTPDPMPTYSFTGEVIDPPVDPEEPVEPTDPVDPPTNGLLHRLAAPVVMDGNNIQTIQMDNAGVAGAPIYVAMSVTPDAVQVRQSAVIMQVLDTANNNALGIVNRPDMGRLLVETGFSGNHIAYPYVPSEGKVKIEFFIDPTLTPAGRAYGPNSHENNSQSDLQLTTESVNRLRFGTPDWGGEVAVAVVHDAIVYSGIPTEAEREAILAALL